jgi:hypothetical protein
LGEIPEEELSNLDDLPGWNAVSAPAHATIREKGSTERRSRRRAR